LDAAKDCKFTNAQAGRQWILEEVFFDWVRCKKIQESDFSAIFFDIIYLVV
jgi:hypothetical protein